MWAEELVAVLIAAVADAAVALELLAGKAIAGREAVATELHGGQSALAPRPLQGGLARVEDLTPSSNGEVGARFGSSRLPGVGRQRSEPGVLDVSTDGEVIEALPGARCDAKHLVNGVVEVTANSGRTNARLFRL